MHAVVADGVDHVLEPQRAERVGVWQREAPQLREMRSGTDRPAVSYVLKPGSYEYGRRGRIQRVTRRRLSVVLLAGLICTYVWRQ